jgi:hypothetical protein
MKIMIPILGALLLSGCGTAQTTLSREPVIERMSGQHDDRALCVYDALLKADYENLHVMEYRRDSTTRVFRGDSPGGGTIRAFDIAFVQETPDTVRAEIRGYPVLPGMRSWEGTILPFVQSCAAP